ncbi:hypothetical protein EON65_00595 [archaeon]|nr:MAG: hypothetical protein EON65_00595 [archaeon]
MNIATGAEHVHRTLMQDLLQLLPPHSTAHPTNPLYTLAVRDDFQRWDEQGESDTSGKVLLVEKAQMHPHRHCEVIQVIFLYI